jgi:tripartite-type tricarboxylate transporter receptor subunit TctC
LICNGTALPHRSAGEANESKKEKNKGKFVMRAWIAVLLLLLAGGRAFAETDEEFYRAKGLTIAVGYTPGSGYDLHARTLARHMSSFLPGHPAIVVQNMPGAGSLNAANHLFRRAPADGSQIALFARGLVMQQLFDRQGIQFDALKFNWIGSTASEVAVVFAWHTSSFRTIADVQNRQMIVAGTGSGANSVIYPYVLNGILGTRFKVITGYPGASETMLAIERGEVDGQAGNSWGNFLTAKQSWVTERKIRVLLQLALKKHPDLPDVPLVMDMAASETDRQALTLIFARQSIAYPFAAPPGVPPARVEILRRAFEQTVKSDAYLTEARHLQLEIDPLNGTEVETIVRAVYASSPAVITRARELIEAGNASAR